MSIPQFEATWPEQPFRWLRLPSSARLRRNALRVLRRQYYLTTALRDSRQALRQNEDITLACLIIIAVMAFAVSTTLTSAVYQYMLAANALSAMLGANLSLLAVLALATMGVSLLWLISLLQNMLSLSLMDGATRKQKRSLVSTIGRSLALTPRSTLAWIGVLAAALVPVLLLAVATLATLMTLTPSMTAVAVTALGTGLISLTWVSYILTTYSLLPYVTLFANPKSLGEAMKSSRAMVQARGRGFIASTYVSTAGLLTLSFEATRWLATALHCNSISLFSMFAFAVLLMHNTLLTMLYRKRRLARR